MNHVRVMASSDSASNAAGRVHLKIAALAYVGACHGPAGDPGLGLASLVALCDVARAYYGALSGRPVDREDEALRRGDPSSPGSSPAEGRVFGARADLRLAALSYATARHGVDACAEFTRATLAVLCGAAIRYAEALAGVDPASSKVTDRMLHLDDGA